MIKAGLLVASTAFVLLAATACGGHSSAASAGSGSTAPTVPISGNTFIPTPPVASTGGSIPGTSVHSIPVTPIPKEPTLVPPPGDPVVPLSTVPPAQINASAMAVPPVGVGLADAGRRVMFDYEQAGCQVISAEVTGEDAGSVHILVVTTVSNRGNQLCPALVRNVQVGAELAAPLGSRVIVFQAVTRHS